MLKKISKIDDLKEWTDNPREITPEVLDSLQVSIRELGDISGIVFNLRTQRLICGHQRLKALKKEYGKKLKVEDNTVITPSGNKFPIRLVDWDEKKERLANFTANNLHLMGTFTQDAFHLLEQVQVDYDALAADLRINKMLDDVVSISNTVIKEGLHDAEEIPEVPSKPTSKVGDLWILGKHRLLCGDCTKQESIKKLFGGHRAQILFTSPPYAQQRDYTNEQTNDWDQLMEGMCSIALHYIAENGSLLVNLGLVHREGRVYRYWDSWLSKMDLTDWPLYDWYVWDKLSGLPGNWRGRLAPAHKWVFHFTKNARRANKTAKNKYTEMGKTHYKMRESLREKDGSIKLFSSNGRPVCQTKVIDSVIRCQPQRGGMMGHPAPFSVAFALTLIDVYTKQGEIVYEPFSGSGTSMIACEQLGRVCYAVDIAPAYVDMAVQRWEQFTGKKAKKG